MFSLHNIGSNANILIYFYFIDIIMFEFIKNLFKKEELEEVNFDDLAGWLNKKIEDNIISKNELDLEFDRRIEQIKQEITEKAEILKNATYDKPIEPKVKSIINQNRQIFLKQIDNIEASEEKLDNFMMNSKKTIPTLKHIYFDETDALMRKIMKIAESIETRKKEYKKLNIELFKEIRTYLIDYEEEKMKKKKFELDLESAEKRLEVIYKYKEDTENLQKQFLDSELAKEYKETIIQKELMSDKLKELDSSLISQFSTLERALKKLAKIKLNQIMIQDYITNPVKTLLADEKLKIIEILDLIKKNIDKLDLKDKKREKTLETINSMTSDKLYKFMTEYNEKLITYKQLNTEFERSKFNKEREQIENNIKDIDGKIRILNKEIISYQKLGGNVNPEKNKKNIIEKLKKNVKIH